MLQDVQRLSTNLSVKLHALQDMFTRTNNRPNLQTVEHLKECINSAMSVMISIESQSGDDSFNKSTGYETTESNGFAGPVTGYYETAEVGDKPQTSSTSLVLSENSTKPYINPRFQGIGYETREAVSTQLVQQLSAKDISPRVVQNGLMEVGSSSPLDVKQSPLITPGPSSPVNSLMGSLEKVSSALPPIKSHDAPQSNIVTSPSSKQQQQRRSFQFWSRKSIGKDTNSGVQSSFPIQKELEKKKRNTKFSQKAKCDVRIKFVFVGDGACGKTSFIM